MVVVAAAGAARCRPLCPPRARSLPLPVSVAWVCGVADVALHSASPCPAASPTSSQLTQQPAPARNTTGALVPPGALGPQGRRFVDGPGTRHRTRPVVYVAVGALRVGVGVMAELEVRRCPVANRRSTPGVGHRVLPINGDQSARRAVSVAVHQAMWRAKSSFGAANSSVGRYAGDRSGRPAMFEHRPCGWRATNGAALDDAGRPPSMVGCLRCRNIA